MDDSNYEEFVTSLAALGEIMGKEVSQMTLETYWRILNRMSIEEFRVSISSYLETGKWFPKPSELLEIVVPDIKSRAAIAYDKMISALGSVGTYASVVFDDPALHSTIESLGGWIEVGQKESDDQWFRKEFERLYSIYARKIMSDGLIGVPLRLSGRVELERAKKGQELEPPKRVGDSRIIDCWQRKAEAIVSSKNGELGFSETLKLIEEKSDGRESKGRRENVSKPVR